MKQVRTKEGSLIPVDASAVIVSIDGEEMTLQQALDEGKTGKDIVIVQVLSDSTKAVPSAHAVKTSVDAVSASVSLLAQNVAELGTSKQNILTPGTGITISSDGVISAQGVVGPQGVVFTIAKIVIRKQFTTGKKGQSIDKVVFTIITVR